MVILAVTVAYQRRKKESQRMKNIWQEMKQKDQNRLVGRTEVNDDEPAGA
jgi:hypothetical protein